MDIGWYINKIMRRANPNKKDGWYAWYPVLCREKDYVKKEYGPRRRESIAWLTTIYTHDTTTGCIYFYHWERKPQAPKTVRQKEFEQCEIAAAKHFMPYVNLGNL